MAKSLKPVIALLVAVAVGLGGVVLAGGCCGGMDKKAASCQTATNAKAQKDKCVEQTMSSAEAKIGDTVCCPVMGSKFKVTEKSLFVVVNDKKIYVCCPGCVEPLKANPGKYLKK